MRVTGKAKTRLKRVVCFLCAVTLILTLAALNRTTIDVKADDEYTYNELKEMFPDATLLKAIYKGLYIEEGESVGVERLEHAGKLEIFGNGELDLSGINNMKGLTELSIYDATVDLKYIANMSSLKNISIGRCTIKGMEVGTLENLEKLKIFLSNGITNLKGLEHLPKLTELDIDCPSLASLEGIENDTSLSEISCVNASLTDISACKNLTNLNYIYFSGNGQLTDISALEGLHSLSYINLYNTNVSDISALKNKTSLTHLDLGYTELFETEENKENSCEVLKSLTNLRELGLRGVTCDNDVMDAICELKGLTSLTVLDGRNISDISKISNLTNLVRLDISNNQILDFSPLGSLPNLKEHAISTTPKPIDRQLVYLDGSDYTLDIVVRDMEGRPVAPVEQDEYTYNAENGTIMINDAYKNSNAYFIDYKIPMNYHGTTFTMEVNVVYTVTSEITITKQPENKECMEGDKVILEVEAESNDNNFTYQWYKDEVEVEGETNASMVISNAKESDAGEYSCIVKNAKNVAKSDKAKLTVNTVKPITIVKQPQSIESVEGESITIEVKAQSEDSHFQYQWYKDGEKIEGETGATIVIKNTKLEDAGKYSCIISNETSSVTSNMASLTIKEKKGENSTGETTTEETTTEETTTEETTEEMTTEEMTAEETTTEETTTEASKEQPTTQQKVANEQVANPTTKQTGNVKAETTVNHSNESAPKTGDSQNIVIMSLLALSIAIVTIFGKKKIKE